MHSFFFCISEMIPFFLKSNYYCPYSAYKFSNIRDVTGYLKLGEQILIWFTSVAPSILPKTGWAIAHSAHPPVTPMHFYGTENEIWASFGPVGNNDLGRLS